MTKFIFWRVAQFPLILAVIYLITFLLAWVAPGNPFEGEGRNVDKAALDELKKRFNAESPAKFLANYPVQALKGDFGPSLVQRGFTVNEIIGRSLPVSLALGTLSICIATILGTLIGTYAAVRRGGIFDSVSLTVALIGMSVPGFVIAGLLMFVFAIHLPIFPAGGWGTWQQMVLPAIALSLAPMAYIARLTRISMIDTLGNDFVRTARAKGVHRQVVIWKHCLRNAFLPVLSYLGPAAAAALTGSFVVEQIFDIPGLGQHFVKSVQTRDQTLILGVVMISSTFILGFNLLVDLSYAFFDPRIDVSAKGAA